MIRKHDYQGACWWCGAVADSREHRLKKTDLVRQFGRGPYRGDAGAVRGIAGELRTIQGPNSVEVKFEASLCRNCNTTRSQQMDLAYDRFISWIESNEVEVIEARRFRWDDIFDDWQAGKDDVKRYLAKHAACRLVGAGLEIGDGIRAFLERRRDQPVGLNMSMEIRLDIVAMLKRFREEGTEGGALWLGDVEFILNQSTGAMRNAYSFYGYRWLRFGYEYDSELPGVTNFDGESVELPADYNVPPDVVREWEGEE